MKHFKKYILISSLIFGVVLLFSCGDHSHDKSGHDHNNDSGHSHEHDGDKGHAHEHGEDGDHDMTEKIEYDNTSSESMLKAVAAACGGHDKLKAMNDVQFDYHYVHPDGLKDISTERYIFNEEVSWARYVTHEINVLPGVEGEVVQYYDGEKAACYNNGAAVEDPQAVGAAHFLRQANFMWFNMMFKMTDPGVIHKVMESKEIDGTKYDVVHVTYDPAITGKEQNDIFILHINPENHMVESFDFSLPAFGVLDPVLHAELTYTDMNGLKVITKRMMTAPAPDGSGMVPMVDQQVKNLKFNNGFTAESLSKDV